MSTLPTARELRRISADMAPLHADWLRDRQTFYAYCWETVLCERISARLAEVARWQRCDHINWRVRKLRMTPEELDKGLHESGLFAGAWEDRHCVRPHEPDIYDYMKARVEENGSGLRCLVDAESRKYKAFIIEWDIAGDSY